MARVTTTDRVLALEHTINDLQELLQTGMTDLNDSNHKARESIQAALRRAIANLKSENDALKQTIHNLEATISDQDKNIDGLRERLLTETKKQGRTQLLLGVILTLVGAMIGWLLAALGNPAQALSIILPLHR